jgi:hypothetical protein
LALIAGALLLVLVGLGVVQHSQRDRFDHARATVFAGTGPLRVMAAGFAADPDFEIERLRPLIPEGKGNDREWAFHILRRRMNKSDIDLFLPELASLPQPYFEGDGYSDSDVMYFRIWIQTLGVDLANLARRVEEERGGTPAATGS